jgi:hypothetical protein
MKYGRKKEEEKPRRKFFWDCETFVVGEFKGRIYAIYVREAGIAQGKLYMGPYALDDFLDFVIGLVHPDIGEDFEPVPEIVFYAFNGHNFDNVYLLPRLTREFGSEVHLVMNGNRIKVLSVFNTIFEDAYVVMGQGGSLASYSEALLGKDAND